MAQNPEDDLINELEEALNDDHKLNLTADQKDEEEDEGLQNEFDTFMKAMNGEGGDPENMMNQLNGMMGNLLKGLGGAGQEDPMKNMKDQFDKIEGDPQFDDMADKLLMQCMNKDILEEPLKETQANYIKYLEENKDKLPQEDFEKYLKQKQSVDAILQQLASDPNQKETLVKLFEEMQSHGDPPKEIFTADNPLNMMQGGGNDCQIF